jgi:hypothetical protein
MMIFIMRRSNQVTAPLLACAAAGIMLGCSVPGECPPSKQNAPCAVTGKSSSATVFGGFGKTFSENEDTLALLAVAGGFILVAKTIGG